MRGNSGQRTQGEAEQDRQRDRTVIEGPVEQAVVGQPQPLEAAVEGVVDRGSDGEVRTTG